MSIPVTPGTGNLYLPPTTPTSSPNSTPPPIEVQPPETPTEDASISEEDVDTTHIAEHLESVNEERNQVSTIGRVVESSEDLTPGQEATEVSNVRRLGGGGSAPRLASDLRPLRQILMREGIERTQATQFLQQAQQLGIPTAELESMVQLIDSANLNQAEGNILEDLLQVAGNDTYSNLTEKLLAMKTFLSVSDAVHNNKLPGEPIQIPDIAPDDGRSSQETINLLGSSILDHLKEGNIVISELARDHSAHATYHADGDLYKIPAESNLSDPLVRSRMIHEMLHAAQDETGGHQHKGSLEHQAHKVGEVYEMFESGMLTRDDESHDLQLVLNPTTANHYLAENSNNLNLQRNIIVEILTDSAQDVVRDMEARGIDPEIIQQYQNHMDEGNIPQALSALRQSQDAIELLAGHSNFVGGNSDDGRAVIGILLENIGSNPPTDFAANYERESRGATHSHQMKTPEGVLEGKNEAIEHFVEHGASPEDARALMMYATLNPEVSFEDIEHQLEHNSDNSQLIAKAHAAEEMVTTFDLGREDIMNYLNYAEEAGIPFQDLHSQDFRLAMKSMMLSDIPASEASDLMAYAQGAGISLTDMNSKVNVTILHSLQQNETPIADAQNQLTTIKQDLFDMMARQGRERSELNDPDLVRALLPLALMN